MESKKCLRCYHEWVSIVEDPKKCPKCQNPFWNKPRVRNVKGVVVTGQGVVTVVESVISVEPEVAVSAPISVVSQGSLEADIDAMFDRQKVWEYAVVDMGVTGSDKTVKAVIHDPAHKEPKPAPAAKKVSRVNPEAAVKISRSEQLRLMREGKV